MNRRAEREERRWIEKDAALEFLTQAIEDEIQHSDECMRRNIGSREVHQAMAQRLKLITKRLQKFRLPR